jgi:hypothetical protein
MNLFLFLLSCSALVEGTSSTNTTPTTTATGTTGTTMDLTIEDVSYTLHPDYESLVQVTWQQSANAEAWVEFSVDDGVWFSSPKIQTDAGNGEALLLGVPYDWAVEFVVHVDNGTSSSTSDTMIANTGDLPNNKAIPTISESDPTQWDLDLQYILFSNSSDFEAIVDRQGRVVWFREDDWGGGSLMPRISADGTDILIESNSYWWQWDNGAASYVERMKIDGSNSTITETPGLHHPYVDLPDGGIIYGAKNGSSEDLIEVSPDGTSTTIFNCKTFTDLVGGSPYCGTNTTWYEASTDTIFWSLYSHDTILEVDRSTGTLLHHFGTKDGAWTFTPTDSAFWWQHGVNILSNGNLITSSHTVENTDECVVREYEMDYATQTLTEVWNFGVGAGVDSETMGEVHRLENGNTLHNNGEGRRLFEVTPSGTIVWNVYWDGIGNTELGSTRPIHDLYMLAP